MTSLTAWKFNTPDGAEQALAKIIMSSGCPPSHPQQQKQVISRVEVDTFTGTVTAVVIYERRFVTAKQI